MTVDQDTGRPSSSSQARWMSLARIGVVASKMTLYTAEATDDVRGASLEQGSVRLGLRRSSAFVLSAIRAQGVLEGSRVLRLVPYRDLRGKRQQPKRQVQTLTPVCLGKFALYGEGLNIGRDGGAPVTIVGSGKSSHVDSCPARQRLHAPQPAWLIRTRTRSPGG